MPSNGIDGPVVMMGSVERVEKNLNRLTEASDRRLDDLEKAVGKLNALLCTVRAIKRDRLLSVEDRWKFGT